MEVESVGHGRGEDTSCDTDAEIQVSRVASELLAVVSPMLEEFFPCELRLMGVRVSSFRGAQATLERGQQRLGRFFRIGTGANSTVSGKLGACQSKASGTNDVVEVVNTEC